MKKPVKIIALALCLVVILSAMSACAEQKPMLSYGDKTLSVNVYQFLLSRAKGTLAYYGYDVDSEGYWRTVVDMQGTTYEDSVRELVKEQAIAYVVADKLFDEAGLTLPLETEGKIDEILATYQNSAGSKSNLNATLQEFGVNYEILREIYIIEAKMAMLKEHLYGKGGEKTDPADREAYYEESYVAFRQIFIAKYEYIIDTDDKGDQVYYADDTHKAIAYDKVNGKTKNDAYGKPIKDIFGNPEYYTEDGRIAYDKEKGVLAYTPVELSNDKKAELYNKARQYVYDCNGSAATFENYAALYDESESDGVMYLNATAGYYSSQVAEAAYFDEMATMIKGLETGECAMYESESGYHVLMRYDLEPGAYDKEENKDYFETFYTDLTEHLFGELCRSRTGEVEVNDAAFEDVPAMIEIGANVKY